MKKYSYIFIVSTPRAGSTLAQTLLMNIEGVVSTYETHFFTRLHFKNFFKKPFYIKNKLVARSMSVVGFENYQAKGFLGIYRSKEVSADFRKNVDAFVEQNKGRYFLEKTPIHLRFIPEIKTTFENVLFVHIVRDAYTNVRSLYSASNKYPDQWGKRSLNECFKRWQDDYEIHAKYKNTPGHLFFNYSDLVENSNYFVNAISKEINESAPLEITNADASKVVESDEAWKDNNYSKLGTTSKYTGFIGEHEFHERYMKNSLNEFTRKLK